MKKKLLLLLFVSFIVWNVYPYVDHAEETTTVSTDQNNDSSKLTKQIESIQADLKDLKEDKKFSTDSVSKEDLYQSLLDREKDVSSSLYNFTMFFFSFIALAVAIGVIYFGKLARDLKEHQKKVDLVMDSKEFDQKVTFIQEKITEFETKERIADQKYRKRYITDLIKRSEAVTDDIYEIIHSELVTPEVKEILKENQYNSLTIRLTRETLHFQQTLSKLSVLEHQGLPVDDKNYVSALEKLVKLEKEMEIIAVSLERLYLEIDNSLASG